MLAGGEYLVVGCGVDYELLLLTWEGAGCVVWTSSSC